MAAVVTHQTPQDVGWGQQAAALRTPDFFLCPRVIFPDKAQSVTTIAKYIVTSNQDTHMQPVRCRYALARRALQGPPMSFHALFSVDPNDKRTLKSVKPGPWPLRRHCNYVDQRHQVAKIIRIASVQGELCRQRGSGNQ